MNKFNIKQIISKHKYAICIFSFMFIYNFIVVGNFSLPSIDDITYTYHIVDYSLGFCAKLLPGAIYNAIFSTTEATVVNIYFNTIYHIFLLAVSFILEVFLKSFKEKERATALVIVMFFITGPETLSVHTYELGMLDTYWLFLTVLFLLFIQNKVLRWAVPALFALSLLIHFSAMVSFIPLFAIILLLEASLKRKDRKVYLAIFSLSVIVSFIVFLYFVIYEKSNLTLTLEEFREFIGQRNKSKWADYTIYYDFAFYGTSPGVEEPPVYTLVEGEGAVYKLINSIWHQFVTIVKVHLGVRNSYRISFIQSMILCLPGIAFLYKYLKRIRKEQKDKLSLFTWLCSLLLLPSVFIMGLLFSTDAIRWLGHGYLTLFVLVMYDMYKRKSIGFDFFDTEKNKLTVFAIVIYFTFYMFCVADPYS